MSSFVNLFSKEKSPTLARFIEVGIVCFLILATIVINSRMIRDGLNGMPDIRWHITWLQHFSQQLSEGIWYPRWLAGTNFGYGSPTFVFYPPLAYYVGSGFKALGLDTQQALIGLFSIALFFCGFNFYLYGRQRWGKLPAVVGSLAFMTAPFLGHNIYFAARLAEIFALLWVPLGLWLTDQALEYPRWRIVLAVFFAIFAISHVPSLLLCFIFWLPYTFVQLWRKPWKSVVTTIAAAFLGFGIVSLYLLPAIREQVFVNTTGLKSVLGGFPANLAGTPLTLNRVFTTRIQNIFFSEVLAAFVFAAISSLWHHKQPAKVKETWCWLAFLGAIAILMSYISLPIWRASTTLQMVQFPWRMMGLFSFGLAALCSLAVEGILKQRLPIKIIFSCAIAGILFWNFHYCYKLSRSIPTIDNPGRGKVANLEHLTIAFNEPYADKLIDVRPYRPLINGGHAAPDPIMGQPRVSVLSGEAEVKIDDWGSYKRKMQLDVATASKFRFRTYFYPAWHLYVNQENTPIEIGNDGTMQVELEPGSYQVELRYQWTQSFTIGIILSGISLLILVLLIFNHSWLLTP